MDQPRPGQGILRCRVHPLPVAGGHRHDAGGLLRRQDLFQPVADLLAVSRHPLQKASVHLGAFHMNGKGRRIQPVAAQITLLGRVLPGKQGHRSRNAVSAAKLPLHLGGIKAQPRSALPFRQGEGAAHIIAGFSRIGEGGGNHIAAKFHRACGGQGLLQLAEQKPLPRRCRQRKQHHRHPAAARKPQGRPG